MCLKVFSHYDSKKQVRLSYLVEKGNERMKGLEREHLPGTAVVFAQLLSSAGDSVRRFTSVY